MLLDDLFWNYYPYSLGILIIPVIIFFMFRREKTDVIVNRVEVFFKGNTKGYYACEVGKEEIAFMIGETVYTEPILYHPRLEIGGKQMFRTYLFAEGTGMIDVPPLTKEDRNKIIKYLMDQSAVAEDLKDKELDTWTDIELMSYIQFYNFDIEQITDKPVMKSFNTSMNAFVNLIDGLVQRIKYLEPDKESTFGNLLKHVVGFLVGFGFAWALTLKGYI